MTARHFNQSDLIAVGVAAIGLVAIGPPIFGWAATGGAGALSAAIGCLCLLRRR
jgi:hypothetical protein